MKPDRTEEFSWADGPVEVYDCHTDEVGVAVDTGGNVIIGTGSKIKPGILEDGWWATVNTFDARRILAALARNIVKAEAIEKAKQ